MQPRRFDRLRNLPAHLAGQLRGLIGASLRDQLGNGVELLFHGLPGVRWSHNLTKPGRLVINNEAATRPKPPQPAPTVRTRFLARANTGLHTSPHRHPGASRDPVRWCALPVMLRVGAGGGVPP